MITGVLIKTDKSGNGHNTAKRLSFEDELDEFYKYLECDCIEIVTRPIGGKDYTIVCDDSGWMRKRPLLSALPHNCDRNAMMVGNLFVCNSIGPNLTSLTPEECDHVISNMLCVSEGSDPDKKFLILG